MSHKPDTNQQSSLGLTQRLKKGGYVGANTLMMVVGRATAAERRKQLRILAVSLLVVIVGGVTAAIVFWPQVPAQDSPGGEPEAGPAWESIKMSSCIVLERDPGRAAGEKSGAGTAWPVAEGLFATNAHVAAAFYDIQRQNREVGTRAELIVRTPGSDPKDLRVVDVKLHPGYASWLRLINKYNPFDPRNDRFLQENSFGACDVALLVIDPRDVKHQPKLLELAGDEAMQSLKTAAEIASFGYPVENTSLDVTKPQPEARFGKLIKFGDFFLRSAEPGEAQMLWYNWGTGGGASGSPIFNAQGRVVALLSAGDVAGRGADGRIGTDATVGPSARFLKELLDGTAAQKQARRDAKWERVMRAMHEDGMSALRDLTFRAAKIWVNNNRSWVFGTYRFEQPVFTQMEVTPAAGKASRTMRLEPGEYIFVAVSEDGPTPIRMKLNGKANQVDRRYHYWTTGYFELLPSEGLADQKQAVEVEVSMQTGVGQGAVGVRVFAIKVVRLKG